jgi:hypothetical protein
LLVREVVSVTTNRELKFTPAEMTRLRETCRSLGTSYSEFVHFATLQALDEVEAYGRDAEALRAYYEQAK